MTASALPIGITRKTLASAFVVITMVLMGGGYWYYHAQAKAIRQRNYENIATIAKMKVEQIVQWRKERLSDAKRTAFGPVLRRTVSGMVNHTDTPAEREELLKIIGVAQEAGLYTNVFLVAADGSLFLAAKDDGSYLSSPSTQRAIAGAVANPDGAISGFFRSPDGEVIIDAVATVRDADGKVVGSVILRCNVEDYLFPLIQSWPTSSRSAETLLVQREGAEVLFLNELRHRAKTALSLRQPLIQTDLTGVQVVLGRCGMFDGKDYRNVEVMADLSVIPGSPWFMVAKVDRDEILVEARYRATSTFVIVGALILLAASATASAYTRQKAGLFRQLFEAERQKGEIHEQFRTILYSIGDAVITTDIDGRIREMNPVAEWLTGWTEPEARGKLLVSS